MNVTPNTSPWANPPKLPPVEAAVLAARKAARSRRRADALAVIIPRLKALMAKPDEIMDGDAFIDERGQIIFRSLLHTRTFNGLRLFFADMVAGTYFSVEVPGERPRRMAGYFNYVGSTQDIGEMRRRWAERPVSDEFHVMAWKRGEWEERLF
ncbi:hypothetical protein RUR49_19025 [Pseudoxanthobacter sp. M-2]|uniref:hypothetical protein n=1 Tax=Pseudoxanthobacter sp. M-2 TaxID=3078754 RepID=UPI0038FCFDED